jgi:hypothetical protein
VDVSNFGSDVSRIDVPAGTDVVLTGQLAGRAEGASVVLADKDGVRIKPFKEGDPVQQVELTWKDDTFRAVFNDVRFEQNLLFQFKDIDGVAGSRQIILKPKDDAPPELIDVAPDTVRKTKDGYIVSVSARVPFGGRIRDDNGLAGVRYAYTLTKIDMGQRINPDALRMYLAAIPLQASRASLLLSGLLYATAQREGFKAQEADTGLHPVTRMPSLPGFERALKDRAELRDGRPELLPLAEVKDLLGKKQRLPYRSLLADLELKPDVWSAAESDPLAFDFPVWQLKLKALGQREIQQRYKMQLWVEAVDTDVDSEVEKDGQTPRPHVSPSKEKFTFLVVSEPELLTEIGKEEEELRVKMDEVFNVVQEAEAKVIRETLDLASLGIKREVLGPMSGRMETVDQLLDKQLQKSKEVYVDYSRILKELRINQVDPNMVSRVDKGIVTPLGDLELEFGRTRDAIGKFRKALEDARAANAANQETTLAAARSEGTNTREQVKVLKEALARILDMMQRQLEINDLIKKLRQIDEAEENQAEMIKAVKKALEDKLLEGILDDVPRKKPKK